jgi:hypothetical protein
MGSLHRSYRQILVGFVFGIILGFATVTFAGKISAPPPLPDLPVSLQSYLKRIYDNIHSIEVTTDNPDGSRNGQKGDMLLLQTGGSSYIEINTDGSTAWLGIVLSDTP